MGSKIGFGEQTWDQVSLKFVIFGFDPTLLSFEYFYTFALGNNNFREQRIVQLVLDTVTKNGIQKSAIKPVRVKG